MSENGQAQLPPHNLEAEQSVIGSLLIDPEAYYEIADFLQPGHFYKSALGDIYRAIGNLLREGVSVDAVTVGEVLEAHGKGKTGDLIGYLNVVPTSVNVRSYARIVHSTALRRRLLRTAGHIATLAGDEEQAIDKVLYSSESMLFDVTEDASTKRMRSMSIVSRDLIDHTEDMIARGGEVVGLETGLRDLDRLLEGLKGSELITLAARPGMGKTSLALSIAAHNANKGKRVALFNLEMPERQIAQRIACAQTSISFRRLRRGKIDEAEHSHFLEQMGRIGEWPMWIDDTPALNPTQLMSKCRRLHGRHRLDLVVVDYLQLMTSDRGRDNRVHEVSDISRALKNLAMMLDVPVLALSQLNRAVENLRDKRPSLAHLRDSGSIEQDSDVVMFIYRDEYYNPETTERPNIAEVDVAKHRNGPTGVVDLYWNSQLMLFRNLMRKKLEL